MPPSGLGLPFVSIGRAFLANGSEVTFDVHYGTVLWDGHPRRTRVNVADTTPPWVCDCWPAMACTWRSRMAAVSTATPLTI